jgi:hypothetical protein
MTSDKCWYAASRELSVIGVMTIAESAACPADSEVRFEFGAANAVAMATARRKMTDASRFTIALLSPRAALTNGEPPGLGCCLSWPRSLLTLWFVLPSALVLRA